MPKAVKDPWQYNDQWNYYKAPGGPETPAAPVVPPQPTRYSDKAFLHTPQAAVGVPILLALVTSCAIMAGTATFIWLIGGYEYVKPVVASGVATFIVSWLAFQLRWVNLTKLEEITGLELDGRPGIGAQPRTGSVRVQVDTVQENGHIGVTKQFDISASPAQLKALCIGLHDLGKSLAEEEWSPLEEKLPFSLKQIRIVKDEMKTRGIIVYVNAKIKNLGYTETIVGRKIIEKWREFDDDISMWEL
jgi:hypothetical protein